MIKFQSADKLSVIDSPLVWTDEKQSLMVKACQELASYHLKNNQDIAKLYCKYNFTPDQLKAPDDLKDIPALGVSAMKKYLLISRPEEKAVLKLTSSGTRGQKTQIWFDQGSLDRVQQMMDGYFDNERFSSPNLSNYVVFGYNPKQAKDLGIAFSENNQLRFAPVNRSYFTLNKDDSDHWVFSKKQTRQIMREYAEEKLPVRIFGMPSFMVEFIEFLGKEQFSFAEESLILTGGGWKAAEDKKISRHQFRQMCSDAFGIPVERIRDGYGMAEHSAPYFECKHHRFHVPVYNRLIIRDPITNKEVPRGEQGLLELISPYNTMMPNLAILSTDWAKIDNEPCNCDWNSPTFTIIGRSGISKHKGCALTADELVKRGVS